MICHPMIICIMFLNANCNYYHKYAARLKMRLLMNPKCEGCHSGCGGNAVAGRRSSADAADTPGRIEADL